MAKRKVNRAPAVVRHLGEPQDARTLHGRMVHRQEKLWVDDWGTFVPCAPYDDHFIYLSPDKTPGSPTFMCTCGSAAVVTGSGDGAMFVCLMHATMGKHATSLVNVRDFPDVGGQLIGDHDMDLER
jgi:hypothetical protein